MTNQTSWLPSPGERVIYQSLRKRRGLQEPPKHAVVSKAHESGTYLVRIDGVGPRLVKLDNLAPLT